MARKNGTLLENRLVQVLIIPTLTILGGLSGFYFLTKDTLSRHETAITETLPDQIKQESKALSAEADARQKNRDEFLDKLSKINDSIGVLNTHAAVQDESDKQIAATLERISRQLEGANLKVK